MSWTRFTLDELAAVHHEIDLVEPELSSEIAPVRDYELRWDKGLDGLGTMAHYDTLGTGYAVIDIAFSFRETPAHVCLIGAIAHELRHAWQYNRFGPGMFWLLSCRAWAQYTTEPSAYIVQEEVELFLGK